MNIIKVGIPALSFFLLWLAFSGFLDPFHLALGVISVIIVVAAVWKLAIFPQDMPGRDVWTALYGPLRWHLAIVYPIVLLLNIIRANLQVAALVVAPKMPIDPVILRFNTHYETDAAKILLGNSITLTPGTVTLDIEDDTFIVHALSPALADSLCDGTDQRRILRLFGQKPIQSIKIEILRQMKDVTG